MAPPLHDRADQPLPVVDTPTSTAAKVHHWRDSFSFSLPDVAAGNNIRASASKLKEGNVEQDKQFCLSQVWHERLSRVAQRPRWPSDVRDSPAVRVIALIFLRVSAIAVVSATQRSKRSELLTICQRNPKHSSHRCRNGTALAARVGVRSAIWRCVIAYLITEESSTLVISVSRDRMYKYLIKAAA